VCSGLSYFRLLAWYILSISIRRDSGVIQLSDSGVGSFDLAPFFVRVRELEAAGKILGNHVRFLYEDGFNLDLCPKEVLLSMKEFGVSTDAS